MTLLGDIPGHVASLESANLLIKLEPARMRNLAASSILAIVVGGLLPWAAVALYSMATLVQIDYRVVFAPGSFEDGLVMGAAFLLPSLTLGAVLAMVVPRSHAIQLAVLSGVSASAIWLVQAIPLGISGTAVSSVSLLMGVLAGALCFRRLNQRRQRFGKG